MSVVSDQDWERVNAYHDGEMSSHEKQAFEMRLRKEPELAAALECVRDVARSLGPLCPQVDASETGRAPALLTWNWAAGGALAASVLVAAFTTPPEKEIGSSEIHAAFLDQTFAVGSGNLYMVAGGSTFPNLGEANLTFVTARETGIGTAAHYAGRNGCRLTFLTMSKPVTLPSDGEMQILQWNHGDHHFAILASGMDTSKFAAIAVYLKQETRRSTQPETVLALRDATQSANRCV